VTEEVISKVLVVAVSLLVFDQYKAAQRQITGALIVSGHLRVGSARPIFRDELQRHAGRRVRAPIFRGERGGW
jgi:hypothetical protein